MGETKGLMHYIQEYAGEPTVLSTFPEGSYTAQDLQNVINELEKAPKVPAELHSHLQLPELEVVHKKDRLGAYRQLRAKIYTDEAGIAYLKPVDYPDDLIASFW